MVVLALTICNILPPSPYSNPFAPELTFNTLPAAPIASRASALAPLTIISPCVVVGDVACPFARKFQEECAVPVSYTHLTLPTIE